MKFVSKNSNYCVVLRQGLPSERLTGRAAVPGVYIRFEDGIANINSDIGGILKEEVCKMMLKNSAYKRDFVLADDEEDPYADTRESIEPVHTITELKYGSVDNTINPKPKIQLDKEKKTIIKMMAGKMAKKMAKEMAEKMAKEMAEKMIKERDEREQKPQNLGETTGKELN